MSLFLTVTLNGLTVAALYFLVAVGFTLIFGLMRSVNLAHGSLYLLGGYLGYQVGEWSGNWYLAVLAGALIVAVLGMAMHLFFLDWMQGEDLRQALVSIGLSVVIADLLLARFGSLTLQFQPPEFLQHSVELPLIGAYPLLRLNLLLVALAIGILLWLGLHRTRFGVAIRAGVDDREMLSALGINTSRLFVLVFAVGAALAGLSGVLGGTVLSVSPGEDARYLLSSLVVTIVGGMGSIVGAAVGAVLVGLVEQWGLAYLPTYAYMLIYVLMTGVLALRPAGLFGRKA